MTADGVALPLFRYAPAGGIRVGRPILLVHELGFGRSLFDLDGEGLAPFLQERGREVFVVELRGHGSAGAFDGWHLADIVARDFAAIAEAIGPNETFDLIACGFGGSLALAATSRELKGRVARVVALSTPIEAEVPNPATEALLANGGRLDRLALTSEGAKTFEMLFALGSKLPGRRVDDLRSRGVSPLGSTAARELLDWMKSGDFALLDGSTFKARIAAYDRPTLLFLPLRDNFAHPEFATPLSAVSRATVRPMVLGRRNLLEEDYSHLAMLHGREAAVDVYTPILQFLGVPLATPEDARVQ